MVCEDKISGIVEIWLSVYLIGTLPIHTNCAVTEYVTSDNRAW